MAEGVILEGYGPGAEAWATEETQEQILKALKSIGKVSDEQVKVLKQAKTDGPEKLFKGVKKESDDLEDSLKDFEKATDEATKAQRSFKKTFSKASRDTASQIGSMLTTITGAGTQMFLDQVEMTLALHESGMSMVSTVKGVSSGLHTFSSAAEVAGLRFQELADLQQNYGNVLNVYGIQRFAKMSKNMQANFQGLGMTARETSEFMAEYMEQQKFYGNEQLRQGRIATEEAKKSAEMFSSWSLVVGKNKKELLKEARERQKESVDVSGFILQQERAGNTAAKNNTALITSRLEESGAKIADMIARRNIQEDANFRELSVVNKEAADMILQARAATRAGIELDPDWPLRFAKAMENRGLDQAIQMGPRGENIKGMIIDTNSHIANLEKEAANRRAGVTGAPDATQAAADAKDAIQKIAGAPERMVAEMAGSAELLGTVSDQLEKFINTGALQQIEDSFASFVADGIPYINKIISSLGDFSRALIPDQMTIGKAVAIGIGGVFAANMVTTMASGAIAKGFTKLMGSAAAGSAGGGAAAKMFKGGGMIKTLGKGLLRVFPWTGLIMAIVGGLDDMFGDISAAKEAGEPIAKVAARGIVGLLMGMVESIVGVVTDIVDFVTGGMFDLSGKWGAEAAAGKSGIKDFFFGGEPEKPGVPPVERKSNTVQQVANDETPAETPMSRPAPNQTGLSGGGSTSEINTSIAALSGIIGEQIGLQRTANKYLETIKRNTSP